ncbi:MAG: hypothetical protein GXZ01_10795 [Clostridiaceae bacterium]|jgi:hypothetical protein|nr:hypothetical protein [Clostridiaceae bacterium]
MLIIIPVVNSSSVLWILSGRDTGIKAVNPPIPVPAIPVKRPASEMVKRLSPIRPVPVILIPSRYPFQSYI